MLKKYIVSTTINSPTPAMLQFIERKDWEVIIVGDLKTPHDEYIKLESENKNLRYLDPEYQEKNYKQLSDAIGFNKIMRRNLGFCEAYVLGADIVASLDDDNLLYDDWGKDLYVGKTITAHCWKSENGVFDPMSVTNANHLWHRGYPTQLIKTKNDVKYMGRKTIRPLVQADLWDGIPDTDAIARIVYQPRIKLHVDAPFFSEDIAPFNSQNTFLAREVIPYYMVLPHAGRMDDIWAAYILQKQFPGCVVFNKPTVYQERHEPHYRNMKDLKDETLGYEYTLKFINGEFPLPDDSAKAYEIYKSFFKNLPQEHHIS